VALSALAKYITEISGIESEDLVFSQELPALRLK
jgi:hypothetical protein